MPPKVDGGRDQRLDLVAVGDVAAHRDGDVVAAERLRRGLGGRRVEIAEHDPGALRDEPLRDREPDPLRPTCDHSGASVKQSHYMDPFVSAECVPPGRTRRGLLRCADPAPGRRPWRVRRLRRSSVAAVPRIGPVSVPTVRQRFRSASCGCLTTSATVLIWAAGTPLVQPVDQLRGSPVRREAGDYRLALGAVCDPIGIGDEAGILDVFGAPRMSDMSVRQPRSFCTPMST